MKKSVDLNGDLPISKSDGEKKLNYDNELPLEKN